MANSVGPDSAIVLFAHGARDPQWAEPFVAIQRLILEQMPGIPVELAYLEIMQPDLQAKVGSLAARGISRITVAPIFMAQGGHLKHDLPLLMEAIRDRYPGVTLRVTQAIGDSPDILGKIANWVVAAYLSDQLTTNSGPA